MKDYIIVFEHPQYGYEVAPVRDAQDRQAELQAFRAAYGYAELYRIES